MQASCRDKLGAQGLAGLVWQHGGLGSDSSLRTHPSTAPQPLRCASLPVGRPHTHIKLHLASLVSSEQEAAARVGGDLPRLPLSWALSHCEWASLSRTHLEPGWPLLGVLCQYCDLEMTLLLGPHGVPCSRCVHRPGCWRAEARPRPVREALTLSWPCPPTQPRWTWLCPFLRAYEEP